MKRSLAILCLLLLIGPAVPAEGQFNGFDRWLASPTRTSHEPHPAIARIVVPEVDGTAYGSGTLVDKRDEYGLVLTNWHVVQGASGPIEVFFPDGFRSQARAIKVDSDWDLAALVIWKPDCEPVRLATKAPQPGDLLTICGYGSGDFRRATGRCTQYYSPQINLPRELVELDVEARQGDSGGPILNDQGELAGVLFGAGRGTTLGSFEGRVKTFLATLAPDIGLDRPQATLVAAVSSSTSSPAAAPTSPQPISDSTLVAMGRQHVAAHDHNACLTCCPDGTCPIQPRPVSPSAPVTKWGPTTVGEPTSPETSPWPELKPATPPSMGLVATPAPAVDEAISPPISGGWFDQIRNALALIGAGALLLQGLKLAG